MSMTTGNAYKIMWNYPCPVEKSFHQVERIYRDEGTVYSAPLPSLITGRFGRHLCRRERYMQSVGA